MIGVGLNMILPARGGDVVRLLMNKKDSELPLTHLFSRIFLEKVMDLAAVALLGAIALFTMGLGQTKNLSLLFVSTAVIISMFVGLMIIKYALEPLRNLFHFLFGLIQKKISV